MDLFSFPFLSTRPAQSVWRLVFFFHCVNFPTVFFFKQHFSVILFLLFWACVGVSQSPSLFLKGFFIYSLCVHLCVHVYTHTWVSNSLVSSLVYSDTVQALTHVWLFATPWTAALQSSLSITNSWSLHKVMSIQLAMPSNHLILCWPFSPCFQSFPASGLFQWVSSSHPVAKVLKFQLQHQSFQWIFRTDFL